ncbi:urease accessory protein UreF [Castellaniella sp.]|uniref:urease accessory protein UreF n=1 Tax=Castellaniella sp. TaxID=1955812 RepID=UPI002AFF93B1|nr:urease accessory UreF family protein [Castellaniella sp.]
MDTIGSHEHIATQALPALLQLADGRFPTGAHSHSGGFEAAAKYQGVDDMASLEHFLQGRLHSIGWVAACFTATACAHFARRLSDCAAWPQPGLPAFVQPLDEEFSARTPSPTLQAVSRRLGRQLLRAGAHVWPDPLLTGLEQLPQGLHQPLALGAVAAVTHQQPVHAALVSLTENLNGPAIAAVRLLGLDAFQVNALIARLGRDVVMPLAHQAARHDHDDFAALPSTAGYLLDITAEFHATWNSRLFAS